MPCYQGSGKLKTQSLLIETGVYFGIMLSFASITLSSSLKMLFCSYVLDFMRGEPLPLRDLTSVQTSQLLRDAEFYQLSDLTSILQPTVPSFSQTLKTTTIRLHEDCTLAEKGEPGGHSAVLGDKVK